MRSRNLLSCPRERFHRVKTVLDCGASPSRIWRDVLRANICGFSSLLSLDLDTTVNVEPSDGDHFEPWIHSSLRSSFRNASSRGACSDASLSMMPMRYTFPACSARASSGASASRQRERPRARSAAFAPRWGWLAGSLAEGRLGTGQSPPNSAGNRLTDQGPISTW